MQHNENDIQWLALQSVLRGYSWEVTGMCFSPDDQWLAVPGTSTVDLWELHGFTKQRSFQVKCDGVAFTLPASSLIERYQETAVRLWPLDSVSLTAYAWDTERLWHAIFSHDGIYLVTLDLQHLIRIWHVPTGEEVLSFAVLDQGIAPFQGREVVSSGLALSPENTVLVVEYPSLQGQVHVWRVDLPQRSAVMQGSFWAQEPRISRLLFPPDATRIGALCIGRDHLEDMRFYDRETFAFQERLRLPAVWEFAEQLIDASFSPDGRLLALTDGQGHVGIWDCAAQQPLTGLQAFLADEDGASFLSSSQVLWSPGGRWLAVSGWEPLNRAAARYNIGTDSFVVKVWAIADGANGAIA